MAFLKRMGQGHADLGAKGEEWEMTAAGLKSPKYFRIRPSEISRIVRCINL